MLCRLPAPLLLEFFNHEQAPSEQLLLKKMYYLPSCVSRAGKHRVRYDGRNGLLQAARLHIIQQELS